MYNSFYGFSEEPFQDTPDPRFYFATAEHQRALTCLRQEIGEKRGWILLSGEPGSGKTILIRHLLQSLAEKPGVKAVYIFQTRIGFEDVLKKILAELNLPLLSPAGETICEHFNRSVAPVLPPGDTLALFLDEAQDFGDETLKKIHFFFNKEFLHPERVQIILSGQTSLEERLKSEELSLLQQEIQFHCSLKPLTAAESRRYIDHRLHLAGGNLNIFNPDALNMVIRCGEGIPRTLNIICDNALRLGHQSSEPKISADMIRKALKETYIQTAPPSSFWKPSKEKSLSRKILYCLAAVFSLLVVIFFAAAYSPQEKGNLEAKPKQTFPNITKEEPLSSVPKKEEIPARKGETEPLPSAREKAAEPPPKNPPASPSPISMKAAKAEGKVKGTINAQKGATLKSLCWEHYGFLNVTLLDFIMDLNPELANPDHIQVNQPIRLPDIQEERLIHEKPGEKIQVFLGTFSDPELARTFAEIPLLKGKEIEMVSRKIKNGETWHRLWAGKFASREEALNLIRALKTKNLHPAYGGTPQKNKKKT